MASTTKIMTCILALENMEEGQIVAASDYAASQPKVRLGVRGKEEYYLKDILYSLMLESHNDSAVVVAEGIAGSVEAFAGLKKRILVPSSGASKSMPVEKQPQGCFSSSVIL